MNILEYNSVFTKNDDYMFLVLQNSLYQCCLRLRGRHLKVNIIFVGVIIALANKSITTNGFTSWSISVMISSLNDYRKPLLNYVGSLSLLNITTCAIEMTGFIIHQKSELSVLYSQFRLPILLETGII